MADNELIRRCNCAGTGLVRHQTRFSHGTNALYKTTHMHEFSDVALLDHGLF